MRPWVSSTPLLYLAVLLILAACGRADPGTVPPAPSDMAPVATLKAADVTLDKVRARHRLRCGVSEDTPGFSERGITGQWRGFDVDLCRAVAAAVLGDSHAVGFTALSSRTRFAALESGAVDLVTGGGSYTFTHDVTLGAAFAGVSYYDSQGFLAAAPKQPRPRKGVPPPPPVQKTIADLNGSRICVQGGSAQQQTLADSFRARGLTYQPVVKDDRQGALRAYQRGECDAVTDDLAILAIDLSQLGNRDRHVVLTEVLADEPMGPVVRQGDDRWADVVRWTLNALVLAEQAKLGMHEVEDARAHAVDPQVRRLLGDEGEAGKHLGLPDDWAYRAVRQVGNYGEIFDRNLGQDTPLKLERGRNALWTADKPGQIYAPPLR
jgi:general L-amino acid transport system substrate-binding protein